MSFKGATALVLFINFAYFLKIYPR